MFFYPQRIIAILIILVVLFISKSSAAQSVSIDCNFNTFSACAPAYNVLFSANVANLGTKTIKSYTWNLGDSKGEYTRNYPDGGSQTPQYITPSTYQITLKVTLTDGTILIAPSKIFTVIAAPQLSISTNPTDGKICVGSSINFQISGGIANSTYSWQFTHTDGAVETPPSSVTSTSLDYIFNNPGENIDAYVQATTNSGCPAYGNTKISVYNKPSTSISITSNSPYCSNTITLQNNTTGGGGNMQYKWYFDGQNSAEDIQTTIGSFQKTLSTGSHRIQLTTDGTKGCQSSSNYYDIYVGTPIVTITPDQTSPICGDQTVLFTANTEPNIYDKGYYHWKVNGVDVPSYDNTRMSYTFSTEGAQNVSVTTDRNCIVTQNYTMQVFGRPHVDFGYQLTPNCPDYILTLTNKTPSTASEFQYSWNLNGTINTNETPTPQNIAASLTEYTVTLTATNKGLNTCSASKSINIPIESKLLSLSSNNQSGCVLTKFSALALLTDSLSEGDKIIEYRWDWGDGSPVETTTSPYSNTHSYAVKNMDGYILTVNAITQKGCQILSSTLTFTVEDACPVPTNGINNEISISSTNYDCLNKTQFTLVNNAGGSNISWAFSDASIAIISGANTNTVTVRLPSNATSNKYYGTLTRTVNGAVQTIPFYFIYVNEKIELLVPTSPICSNATLLYDSKTNNPQYISYYTWSFDNVAYNYNSKSFNYGFSENGTHAIKLVYTDNNSCKDSVSTTVSSVGPNANFTVAPLSNSTLKGDIITTCDLNFSGTLSDISTPYDNSANYTIQNWKWLLPNNTTATGKTTNMTIFNNYSSYITYNAFLTVTDAQGCSDTLTKEVAKAYYPIASYSGISSERCPLVNESVYTYDFSNTSSAYNASYTWDYNDGTTSVIVNDKSVVKHTFPHLTNNETEHYYTPILSLTDENGCVATTANNTNFSNFVKLVRPVADFSLINPTSQCIPSRIGITNNSIHGVSYYWDYWGDNSEFYNQKSTDPAPAYFIYDKRVGDYLLKLTTNGPDGCISTASQAVHLKGPTGTLIQNPTNTSINNCTPYYPHLQVKNSTAESYSWNFDDNSSTGQYINDSMPDFSYNYAGAYNPVVTMYGQGCSYTLQLEPLQSIVVYDVPKVTITPLTSSLICQDSTITLGSTVDNPDYDPLGNPYILSYTWTPKIPNNTGSSITTTLSGNTTFKLAVNNGKCTSEIADYSLQAISKPQIIAPKKVVICQPDQSSANFSLTLNNADLITWSPTNSITQTGNYTFTTSAKSSGIYQFTASSSDGVCPPATESIPIIVSTRPTINNIILKLGRIVPEVFVSPSAGAIAANQQVTLRPDVTSSSSTDTLLYQWTGPGLSSYTAKYPYFGSNKNVTYQLTVSNQDGCSIDQSVSIQVIDGVDKSKYQLNIPNAFTPNGDGKNDYFYITGYGISEVSNFTIYNRWGKIIFTKKLGTPNTSQDGWDGTFNGELQPTDTYIYTANVKSIEGKTYPVKGTIVLVR